MIIPIDILPLPCAKHSARDAVRRWLLNSNEGGHEYGFAADAAGKFL